LFEEMMEEREILEGCEDKDVNERMSHFKRVDIIFKEIQNPLRKSDSLESKILTDFIAESARFSLLIFELKNKQRWSSYSTKLSILFFLLSYIFIASFGWTQEFGHIYIQSGHTIV
jgi:hypothetical protein